ncbi:MAG: YdcF family protein [Pseudomonadota bacterium]
MRVFLTVIVLALLAYAIGFVLFVSNLPVAPAAMPKADGIVVLTGGDERLETAVSMLERGIAKRLLVSGTSLSVTKETVGKISGGGLRFDCCADIGYAAEDTHGNAEETATWAREHKFDSLVIVTGRHHMPRTLKEFSTAMPDITLIAYPVDQSGVALGEWWKRPRTAQFLHREYFKYLASLVTTRLARG